MTDIGIRRLIFDFEGPEMLYGMSYFIFIFWIDLHFYFQAVAFLLETPQVIHARALWATVFLMLSSAT